MNLFDLPGLTPIETTAMPSPEEFVRRFVRTRTAVLLDGVAEQIPEAANWSYDHFAGKLDTIRIQRPSPDGVYHYLGFERIPFDEFARSLRQEGSAYALEPLFGSGVAPERSERLGVRLPAFIPPEEFRVSNLYLGPGGNTSLLHYDEVHSLLIMTTGQKRFVLFPPEETRRMYPYGILHLRSILEGRVIDSRLNGAELDLDRFPLLREARGWTGVMSPGQALFIPAGTWHYISAEGLNVSVNYFWGHHPLSHWLQRPLLDFWFRRRWVIAAHMARRVRDRARALSRGSREPASGA